MKKICSFVLALCMILSSSAALADGLWLGGNLGISALTSPVKSLTKGDQPFEDGVNYGEKYKEYGAVPSMLNFGSANLSPGESLYDAKTTTTAAQTGRLPTAILDIVTFSTPLPTHK